jgi:hypothetical protein
MKVTETGNDCRVKSFLPNIGRFIISRKMRREGYAATMEGKVMHAGYLWENWNKT